MAVLWMTKKRMELPSRQLHGVEDEVEEQGALQVAQLGRLPQRRLRRLLAGPRKRPSKTKTMMKMETKMRSWLMTMTTKMTRKQCSSKTRQRWLLLEERNLQPPLGELEKQHHQSESRHFAQEPREANKPR